MYRRFFKRLLDIIISAIVLLVMLLPMLILAIVIKLDSPGPVVFWQKRIGIHKSTFMMPKFRTMYADTPKEVPTHLLENPDKWITRCGKWMRKMSVDELPQVICILTGKMSIVGPRPALWNQFDLVEERDRYGANDIRPGLTGWAQIHGRDELEIAEKARLDGYYAENYSFGLDCKCFFKTFRSVLKHDGYLEGGTGNSANKIPEHMTGE